MQLERCNCNYANVCLKLLQSANHVTGEVGEKQLQQTVASHLVTFSYKSKTCLYYVLHEAGSVRVIGTREG